MKPTRRRHPTSEHTVEARTGVGAGWLCIAALLAGSGLATAQPKPFDFEIFPVEPGAQQDVHARVYLQGCRFLSEVSHAQGTISIGVQLSTACWTPRPEARPFEVTLGKLPQGDYRVQLVDTTDPARPAIGLPQILTVAPLPPPVPLDHHPLLDHSGWWMSDSAQPGEGWLVEHRLPGLLVFSWVTYDEVGEPTWLNMEAQRQLRAYVGPVYRTQRLGSELVRTVIGDGRFDAPTADMATFTLTPAGTNDPPVTYELRRLQP